MKKSLFISLIASLLVTACGSSVDSTSSQDLESQTLGGKKDEVLAEDSSNAPIIKRAVVVMGHDGLQETANIYIEFIDKSTDELGFYVDFSYGKGCKVPSEDFPTTIAGWSQEQFTGFNTSKSGQILKTVKSYFMEYGGYEGDGPNEKSAFFDAWANPFCEISVTVVGEFCDFWEGQSCPNETKYQRSKPYIVTDRI